MLSLLDQLDQRQLRLGTYSAVAHVAGRHIDTRAALLHRFQKFFLSKVRLNDNVAKTFRNYIDLSEWTTVERKAKERRGNWVYVAELWLADRRMPSHVGPIDGDEKRAAVFLDLSRQLGLLNKTFALTEVGAVLRSILPEFKGGEPEPNPLLVSERMKEQALYTYILLRADILTPFLLERLAEMGTVSAGAAGSALLQASGKLLDRARQNSGLSQAMGIRHIWEYHKRLKEHEKAREHNVRPRLEFFVDLGLLTRSGAKDDGSYRITDAGRSAASQWAGIVEEPHTVDRFLERGFFTAFARMRGIDRKNGRTPRQCLLAFARAFPSVARPIGYTPGRSVALAACLSSLLDGEVVEIDELIQCVRDAAHTAEGKWLQFSGGSRFDRELLIRIDPGLTSALTGKARQSDSTNKHP
jgi:hypothetical protein